MDLVESSEVKHDLAMMTEEDTEQLLKMISQRRPNLFLISDLCQNKIIPDHLRATVWAILLRIDRHTMKNADATLSTDISATTVDMENQRVIEMDTKRTNGIDPYFREEATRMKMEKLLTFYCKRKSLAYKQGLNFVLAPFMKLQHSNNMNENRHSVLGDGQMFEMFYAFIERLMPNVFADDEFRSLQFSLKVFRLLLLYHDPQLGAALDQNDVIPELYATPWFLTLFSRTLPLKACNILWDFYLTCLAQEEFLYVHFFVCLGVLLDSREAILTADKSEIPAVASQIPPVVDTEEETEAKISKAIAHAVTLREQTPNTFLKLIYEVAFAPNIGSHKYFQNLKALKFSFMTVVEANPYKQTHMQVNKSAYEGDMLQKALDQLLVCPMQPVEILRNLQQMANEGVSKTLLKFFVLDCRSEAEFSSGHFAASFHMDPGLLDGSDTERLESLLEGFRSMNAHFVFLGTDNDVENSMMVAKFVLFFLQRGFRYVSACLEGFAALVDMISEAGKKDLVVQDHAENDDEVGVHAILDAGLSGLSGLSGWISSSKKLATQGVQKAAKGIGERVAKVKTRVRTMSQEDASASRPTSPCVSTENGNKGVFLTEEVAAKTAAATMGRKPSEEDEGADVAVRLFGSNLVGAYSSLKTGVFNAWGGKQRKSSKSPSTTSEDQKTSSTLATVAAKLKQDETSVAASMPRTMSFEEFFNEQPDLV